MKNKNFWLGILGMVLVFGMAFVGCGNDDSTDNQTVKYEGKDVTGNTYILTITEKTNRAVYTPAEGDSYVLIIKIKGQPDKKSRGTVKGVSADGTFTLQPSVEGSDTFSVVISGEKISSVSGDIAVEGGDVITPRTFSTLYLRAHRYYSEDGLSYGEQWDGSEIKLYDFIKVIPQKGDTLTFSISGQSDKKMEYFQIIAGQLNSSYDINSYYYLGGSERVELPVSFSGNIFEIPIINDIDPDVDVVLSLIKQLWQKYKVDTNEYYNYNYGTIPEDIPDGTIMATISNFSISLVGDGK